MKYLGWFLAKFQDDNPTAIGPTSKVSLFPVSTGVGEPNSAVEVVLTPVPEEHLIPLVCSGCNLVVPHWRSIKCT